MTGQREFTILFVEDDSGVRASTEEVLEKNGFRLLVAKDGEEALRLLEENDVQVLFTDVVMPGLDGIALAQEAKLLQPDIQVMFMTAYYSRAADAARLGKILFKPLRAAELVEALHSLMKAEP